VVLEEIHASGCKCRRLPRADVLHGDAASTRERGAEDDLSPDIASGKLRLQAFAVTEPTSGSDSTKLRAERQEHDYIVRMRHFYLWPFYQKGASFGNVSAT
jgi:acyl-CoA dehydrogenase